MRFLLLQLVSFFKRREKGEACAQQGAVHPLGGKVQRALHSRIGITVCLSFLLQPSDLCFCAETKEGLGQASEPAATPSRSLVSESSSEVLLSVSYRSCLIFFFLIWWNRGRTKLKKDKEDSEVLKRNCERLTHENRRLERELLGLRAINFSSRLSMCPSCLRIDAGHSKMTPKTPALQHVQHNSQTVGSLLKSGYPSSPG